jgi:hypothetical protein
VCSSTGEEVFFKIKTNTKLSKLQVAYANKVGKDVSTIRYVHELWVVSELDVELTAITTIIYNFAFWMILHSLLRFLYDGQRINEDDTPASLEMEDNGMLIINQPDCLHFADAFRFAPRYH